METCRFLVSGDVKGNFKKLFSKVEKSIKKCGSFAFLLCTGSFFGENSSNSEWEYYNSSPDNIPIQVYVLGPNSENEAIFYVSDKPFSLNEKITFVGKSGVFTTCEGIKVAYVSGLESLNETANLSITDAEIKNLTSKDSTVDLLFTSQWPYGITCSGMIDYEPKFPSKILVKLIKIMKPRYFFSGWENKYYERIPLCHADKDGSIELLTRFVGLAFVGNTTEKWLYAVNMDLQRKISMSDHNKINLYLKFQPQEQYYLSEQWHISRYDETPDRTKQFKGHLNAAKTFKMKSNCWFCLSNENSQNHLIISVGMKVYLSLSKGGLVRDHLCLIPINHVSSISQVDDDIRTELNYYKNKIKHYYIKKNMKVIFFERFYKTIHAEVNCIPMKEGMSCNVKASFMEKAAEIGLKMNSFSPLNGIFKNISSGSNYFHVELADNESLLCEISPDSDFPLNFGRDALVRKEVLNQPEKALWKRCILEMSEEKSIVNELRNELLF